MYALIRIKKTTIKYIMINTTFKNKRFLKFYEKSVAKDAQKKKKQL